MAQARSRRLRKKLHLDEFQEFGFTVEFSFKQGTDIEEIDSTIDAFINEVIEPNGLAFDGSGYLNWEAIICLQKTGKCTEEHREIVGKWLEQRSLTDIKISELFDVWWD